MSADRDLTRIVRSWLQTGEHESADRVLDVVFGRLDTTPQRRPVWVAWRETLMKGTTRFAVAGATMLVLAVAGYGLYLNVANMSPAASPTMTPSLAADVSSPAASTRALTRPQTPSGPTRVDVTEFVKPFSLTVPLDSEAYVREETTSYVTLDSPTINGGGFEWAASSLYLGPRNEAVNGIIVARAAGASLDKCPRGIGGRGLEPNDDVVEVLRNYAGFTLTSTPTTISGRPASVLSNISAACLDHLHLGGSLESPPMALTARYEKVYLVPFDDTSVIIQAWAASAEEADGWLPVAQQIIDSIEFAPETPSNRVTTSGVGNAFGFAVEFSYVAPAWEGFDQIQDPTGHVFGFEDTRLTRGRAPSHGVVVAALSGAVVHGCRTGTTRDRVPIRMKPAELLEDMERVGGFTFSEPVEDTFDGRPALIVDRSEGSHACDTADLHIGGPLGSRGEFLRLGNAGKSIVMEVDGKTVLIDIWADTAEELGNWLPTASNFVYSIHFRSPAT